VVAGPCSNTNASGGGSLEIDFVAFDVDKHLAYYSLVATYGKNLGVNLLAVAGATLTAIPLGSIPPADSVGPDYGTALGQSAVSPYWRGGGLRLTVPDIRRAFPETCCYKVELDVRKRTVVDCNHDYLPRKTSFYTLTVVI
jgi:hypothetical protein